MSIILKHGLFFLVVTGFYSCALFNHKQHGEIESKDEKKSEALEALQFFSKTRSFPGIDIPSGAHASAFEMYSHNYPAYTTRAGGIWQNIGPNNIGGRTLCAAIDPNDTSVVWLGSASGGLWKSTTGGIGTNAWTYVETGYPILGVSSIAIDPINSNIMYIGTGETYNYGTSFNGLVDRTTRGSHGMGILKSTDGGLTWSYSLNWSYQSQRGIWEIIINPLNPNVLYAATTEGIYKSNDAGITWNQVLSVLMAMDLEIDRVDTNIVYAGIGNFGSAASGLYKTSNSGASWNVLAGGLPTANTGRICISAYPSNNKILAVSVCDYDHTLGIYKSMNEGLTWSLVDNTTDIYNIQGWFCKGLVFYPTDSIHLLAAGMALYDCDTAGTNFEVIGASYYTPANPMHPDFHDVVINPLDPNKIYLLTDGGLYRSNDFGKTSFDCNGGYVTSQFYVGSTSAYTPNLVLGGMQDNGTALYIGSTSWDLVNTSDGCYNAIDPYNDDNMYTTWQNLLVYKSTDHGSTKSICFSPTEPAAFVAPMVMCPAEPDILYAGAQGMYRTTDAGVTWSGVGPNPLLAGSYILSIGVSGISFDTLYCGIEPYLGSPMKIFKSINGSLSYTDVTGSLPDRYPRDIVVDAHNSNNAYVVFSGFGTGHIFKTNDGGGSWTDISTSLPDVPFHCLAIHPNDPNTLFAGSDLGVFLSNDGGTTWSNFTSGMPMAAMVFDLVIAPVDTSIYAYTHGNGVYKRSLQDAVGIDEVTTVFHAQHVYPNPASTELNISCDENLQKVVLYSCNGQFMQNAGVNINGNMARIDVHKIPSGVYFLVMESAGKTAHQRVVIER